MFLYAFLLCSKHACSVMGGRLALSSPLPDLIITGPYKLLIELVCSLQQEVGQEVGGIIGHILAQVDQAFSQVRHNLVHKILPNWLRSLV